MKYLVFGINALFQCQAYLLNSHDYTFFQNKEWNKVLFQGKGGGGVVKSYVFLRWVREYINDFFKASLDPSNSHIKKVFD